MSNVSNKTILIVEDEDDIRELLIYNLKRNNFLVESTSNGNEALVLIKERSYDLILLDLMIPGLDGINLVKKLKSDEILSKIPILILTAKSDESDIVLGLEIGADDYLTKPFSIKVLIARIKKIFSWRGLGFDNNLIKFKNLSINLKSRDVVVNGEIVSLTFTEFEILRILASNPNWVFTRSDIINKIRGDNYIVTDRTIDFQIVGLRKKIGSKGKNIKTVRNVGYRYLDQD